SCGYKLLLYRPNKPAMDGHELRHDPEPVIRKPHGLDPRSMRPLLSLIFGLAMSFPAFANLVESHGYAQFGTLKYPASFTHFDWVNPDAPKGGTLRVMAYGTFDTLNPYSFKGSSPASAP